MKRFIDKLKRQAEENPLMALAIGAAVVTATSKLIDAQGRAAGSKAYARDVDRRVRASR